jgi:hypothetical protein
MPIKFCNCESNGQIPGRMIFGRNNEIRLEIISKGMIRIMRLSLI